MCSDGAPQLYIEASHVGFGLYTQATRQSRFRGKRPRERFQYKQHVYVFSSFFNVGYTPNARSHNVTQVNTLPD